MNNEKDAIKWISEYFKNHEPFYLESTGVVKCWSDDYTEIYLYEPVITDALHIKIVTVEIANETIFLAKIPETQSEFIKLLELANYDDAFCSDLDDLVSVLDLDEDNVNDLKDDWNVKVELSDLEPIFEINAKILCQVLFNVYEDRTSEDYDDQVKVLKALKEAITITKADLVEWFYVSK